MKVRPARSEGVSLGAVILIVLVLIMGFAWYAKLPPFAPGGVIPSGQTTSTVACDPTQARLLQTVVSHYSGDSALTGMTVNYYLNQGGTYNLLPAGSNPGSISAEGTAVSSVQTWSLSQGILAIASATGAYPAEGVLGQPVTMGGVTVLTTSCATVNQNNYFVNAFTLLQAPGSGTSATTNTFAFVLASNGASLTTKSNPMPTSPTLWNVQLKIAQPYRGAGYTYTVYSTASAPVTNYATGQVGNAQVTSTLLVFSNQTGINLALDPSASGLTLQSLNLNTIQAGTKAWIISGFNGCSPAPSSASSSSPYTCLNVPIQIYETIANTGKHVAITFIFVDNQQLAWILNNASDPAASSFPTTTGSAAGIPTGFSFLTPTGGNNAGNPAPLIQQYFTVIQTY